MPIVSMPDGKKVRFPDDISKEEIGALIAEKFPDAVAKVKPRGFGEMTPEQRDPQNLTQMFSGVNEGIADLAGFGTDAVNAALKVGPTIYNAVTGSNVQGVQVPDIGEPIKQGMENIGAIKPPTDNPNQQFMRRVGREVGSVAIPGLGLASRIGSTAKAAKVLITELASATSSGAAAATAQQLFPGNQAAELTAQVLFGFGPGFLAGAVRRGATAKSAPTAEMLQLAKREAYQRADGLGAKYSQSGYGNLLSSVEGAVKADNISPTRHPKASSFVDDMKTRGASGMTLTELDQLRQEVRRDLLRSSEEAEQHFGGVILDEIDKFIANPGQAQMVAGSADEAASAITTARELNTRWRKTEMIEDAIYAAQMRAAASGSGGNIANTTRQAFNSILLNDRKRRAFSGEEIRLMETVVKDGITEDVLRLAGKLSPSGNGLSAWLGLFAATQGYGVVPAIGLIAKPLADMGTVGKASALRANVARGGPALQTPIINTEAASALAIGQASGHAANDNALRNIRLKALN